MRTTIVVEDAGPAVGASATAQVTAERSSLGQAAPVDAGGAPVGEGVQTGAGASSGASDGGMPPTWLVEAIAQAGGMTSPVSPEDIELAGLDAGSAPA
jgi:hypothetical protein